MTQKINLKQAVHRNGSERAAITICLNDPMKIIECTTQGLTPQMMAVDGHKYIYMAIQYLVSNEKTVDPVSILNVYNSEEAVKAITELGGIDYIDTMQKTPVASNIDMFIDHIKQAALRRAIYEKAEEIQKRVLRDETTNTVQLIGQVENEFRELGLAFSTNNEAYTMGQDINARLKERIKNPTAITGLKTGWRRFDEISGGLGKGELTIIGARPKVGKSTTLLNWSNKIAIDDKIPTLYIDTEMTDGEQENRLLSMRSGVPEREIKSGMFSRNTFHGLAKDKIPAVQKAAKEIKKGKLFHVYMPYFTADAVVALVKKFQIKEGIQMVVFDYIKLPSSDSKNANAEYQMLGYFTSSLKDMAGSLGLTVISAVQLNRSAIGAEELNDSMIGGSDRILQLANRLCFLRNKTEEEYAREGGAQAGNQKFKIAFQRGGESDVDDIAIKFDKPIIRMQEAI